MGELLAIIALVLYASNIFVTKIASDKLDLRLGFSVSVLVNVVGGGAVVLAQLGFRQTPFSWHPGAFGLFMLAGVFSTYLGRWLFFHAVALLGPAKASAFQSSNPIFTVIVAWLFLGERLSSYNLLAIGVTTLGLVLVNYTPGVLAGGLVAALSGARGGGWVGASPGGLASSGMSAVKVVVRSGRLARSGAVIALVSAVSYAVSHVLRAGAIGQWNEPALGATIGALVGMVIHFVANGSVSRSWSGLRTARRDGLLLYCLIGVLTIAAQVCSMASLHYIPVSLSNMITMATPLLVVPASFFLLRNQENLKPKTLVGIGLVLAGVAMVLLG